MNVARLVVEIEKKLFIVKAGHRQRERRIPTVLMSTSSIVMRDL